MKTDSRRHLIFVICFMVLALLLSQDVTAKTLLKMNHQFPETAAGSKIDQWFADEVKKGTNGEVEIRIFWSNALGEPKENLPLLSKEFIDMAGMSPGYFPSELPFHCAPNSIPMGMDNICQSSAIMKAFITKIPAFMEEASQNSIRPLFFHLLNPYLLVSKKPVTKFSDMKDMKIRTWGKDMPRLVKAAGGKPATLFLPDIYGAMKQGAIDGCPFSVDLVVTYKIYELAKHITEVVMWEGPAWGVWISEKSWQKISPENQKIILETVERAREKELVETSKSEVSSREFLKSKGVKFHQFPPEELAEWEKANPDFFGDWIKKMEEKGKGDSARQTIQLWKEMRKTVKCP
ncbi:MAG: hypothetical protein GY795_28410 [Desulfobacterales bacterium]|nr:hypothetical protein [Desulfobacterales bacterium]